MIYGAHNAVVVYDPKVGRTSFYWEVPRNTLLNNPMKKDDVAGIFLLAHNLSIVEKCCCPCFCFTSTNCFYWCTSRRLLGT